MFLHESEMGNAGTAVQTHSWGNTRRPLVGPTTPVGDVPGRSGSFPVWANWLDGLTSTVDRLASQDYPDCVPYGKRTIHEVFADPCPRKLPYPQEWAPAGDLNNPKGYEAAVLAFMNKHQDIREKPVGNPLAKLTTSQEFIPKGNPNRPGLLLRGGSANFITVHEVGNLNPQGGTARATRNFVHNGGGDENVSFQAVVGDTESIQLLPWNEVGWHAGDGSGDGNHDSIAIETQQVGNWAKTIANLAKLVAALMKEFNIPISRVVQHNHWSGKNCPQYLRAGRAPITGVRSIDWPQFLGMVQAEYAKITAPAKAPIKEMTLDEKIIAFVNDNTTLAISGFPVRGGLVDLTEFGGTSYERLIKFERLVAHTLNGNFYVLTLDLYDRLRAEGKVKMD